MKEFVESNHIKDGDLRILNIMRMSIKAVTLSDICNLEGTKITSRSWYLQGSHETQKNQVWPRNPPKFTERQKKLWKDSLKAVFGNSYAREDRQLHLNFWLGSWTSTKIRDEWECFYSVSVNRIYVREKDQWRLYRSNNTRRSKKFTKTDNLYDEIPDSRA